MQTVSYSASREDSHIEQNHYLMDKLVRSREQFARYDASACEFAREMDARYRAMLEGSETARDLIESLVEGRDAPVEDCVDESDLEW